MATTFFADNLTYINNVCTAYIGANVAAVAQAIAPTAYTLLGVYVVLWGFASLRGMIQEPFMDMATRLIKIGFIFGVGISLMEYNVYVTDTFFNGPEQLAGALTSQKSSASTIVNSLDAILTQGFTIGKKFWDKAGLLSGDFGMYLVAGAIFLETIFVVGYSFFLIVLAKLALSVIIVFGPLYIVSLLFQPTANFFNSWVQQLTNYFMVMVLVVATNVLLMTLFARAATGATAITDITQIDLIFPFVITGLICLLVLASITSIAAGLAGGMALSSFGLGRMVAGIVGIAAKKAIGSTTKAIGSTTKLAAKGTKKVARAAWSGYQNSKRNAISNP
jgi:type IV secretion system protein VirB6